MQHNCSTLGGFVSHQVYFAEKTAVRQWESNENRGLDKLVFL